MIFDLHNCRRQNDNPKGGGHRLHWRSTQQRRADSQCWCTAQAARLGPWQALRNIHRAIGSLSRWLDVTRPAWFHHHGTPALGVTVVLTAEGEQTWLPMETTMAGTISLNTHCQTCIHTCSEGKKQNITHIDTNTCSPERWTMVTLRRPRTMGRPNVKH